MSFVALLAAASRDASSGVVSLSKGHPGANSVAVENDDCVPDDAMSARSLVHHISEYLFDLFDANCTAEYHRIANFEREAVELFIGWDTQQEYTNAQHEKYDEFKRMFEEMVGGEIIRNGWELEAFVKEVGRMRDGEGGVGEGFEANDEEIAGELCV